MKSKRGQIMYARSFAILKHGRQMYGNMPYIIHLQDVYLKAQSYRLSEDEQAAAYLHDTIEDTNTTKEELAIEFNINIANLVYSVTGEGKTRAEQKESIIEKLTCNKGAINLKIIDRMSNIEASLKYGKYDLVKMYLKEHNDYMQVFQFGQSDLLEDYLLTVCGAQKTLDKTKTLVSTRFNHR